MAFALIHGILMVNPYIESSMLSVNSYNIKKYRYWSTNC